MRHLLFAVAMSGAIGVAAGGSVAAAEPEQGEGTHVLYVTGQPDGFWQIAMPNLESCERAESELLEADMQAYGGHVACGVHPSILARWMREDAREQSAKRALSMQHQQPLTQSEFEDAMRKMRPLTPEQILASRERLGPWAQR